MSIVNTLSLESNRQIKINFDGGDLSSDAGLLLIKEFVRKLGIDNLLGKVFKTNDSALFRYHTDQKNLLQITQWKEADPERAQLFSPAEPVVSEYGFDVVFINGWIALTDYADATAFFVVPADPLLVGKRDLGVGNHGG